MVRYNIIRWNWIRLLGAWIGKKVMMVGSCFGSKIYGGTMSVTSSLALLQVSYTTTTMYLWCQCASFRGIVTFATDHFNILNPLPIWCNFIIISGPDWCLYEGRYENDSGSCTCSPTNVKPQTQALCYTRTQATLDVTLRCKKSAETTGEEVWRVRVCSNLAIIGTSFTFN